MCLSQQVTVTVREFPYTGMEDGVKESGIVLHCSKRRSRRTNSSSIDREIGNNDSGYIFGNIRSLWSYSR